MKVQIVKCSDKYLWYGGLKLPIIIEDVVCGSTQKNSDQTLSRFHTDKFYYSQTNKTYFYKSDCINDEEKFDDLLVDNMKCYKEVFGISKVKEETIKNDTGKPQYSDLPVKTLRSVTKAFNYGAIKYSKFNYTKGLEWLRYYDACMRHMEAWREFEDIDEESTSHHVDNAIASLMMLRENIHLNSGVDNRNKDYKLNK